MPKAPGMVIDLMAGPLKKGPDVSVDAKAAALKEFFTAGKAGDYEAAAHAFKKAYDLCAMASETEKSEYPEEE